MSEMKVGDIGVLQNMEYPPCLPFEGTPAEIIDVFVSRHGYSRLIKQHGVYAGYIILDCVGDRWTIHKHQIRPLRDPDQEQTKEDELEIA